MKKSVLLVLSLLFVFAAVGLAFAAKGPDGKFDAKVGDEIYACACGAGCDCGTLGKQEGNCACGQKMAKTKVTKIEKGRVYYMIDGKELSAPTQGKYACGCGEGCNCGYIGQKPGKCGCDKDMVKVKQAKKTKK
jgi:hypothetical protein